MTSPNLDRVLDAVFRVNADFGVEFVSEAGQHWLGLTGREAWPRSFLDLLHPDDAAAFRKIIAGAHDLFTCELRVMKGGAPCWVSLRGYPLPPVHQFVVCLIDISTWKSDSSAFRYAAEHDELTDLANRGQLKRRIDELVRGDKQPFVLALLDLDGFKKVNDTFGHSMGDAVLVETARRLRKVVGADDLVARLGGDEFVLLLRGKNAAAAQTAMAEVLYAIARPFETAPHDSYLGVSIGLAEYPAHGDDYSTLLKHADIAMYRAKNDGKNRVNVYCPISQSADFSIEAAIHGGIEEGEFSLFFQPQYDMRRRLVGAEALMRWTSRRLGPVSPDQFIPIAEECGLMPLLGQWALRYACHQLRQFSQCLPGFAMSVNVSPVQFGADNFDALVLGAVGEMGVDPSCLILEITESTLMHSQEKTERSLQVLRDKGVRFSIDDFGTGFSSLSYLTRFPVSSIKIDKSFVWTIGHPTGAAHDQKLVTAMIHLAHSIGLKVVAEGVENDSQFEFLKQAGCDVVQGYLTGKPMPAEAMLALLRAGEKAHA